MREEEYMAEETMYLMAVRKQRENGQRFQFSWNS
jgi:hypothetical protein